MKLNWKLFAPLVVAIIVWLIGAPEGLSANSWIYVSIFGLIGQKVCVKTLITLVNI